jgi:hypothetical protein
MPLNQVARNKDLPAKDRLKIVYVCIGKSEYQISKVVETLKAKGAMEDCVGMLFYLLSAFCSLLPALCSLLSVFSRLC